MKTECITKQFIALIACLCMFATSYSKETSGNVNGHLWVDLGLPSGVLWASNNIGANAIEDYGSLFAWGETSPKQEYNYDNSIATGMNLGCISGNAKYDAARANWGDEWCMPTREEFQELIDNCTWKPINFNGVDGLEATSKINNMCLFFPAAGEIVGDEISCLGTGGVYWSSTPASHKDEAYLMAFGNNTPKLVQSLYLVGKSIRPVINPINDPDESVIYYELNKLSTDELLEHFLENLDNSEYFLWIDGDSREAILHQSYVAAYSAEDKTISFILLERAVNEGCQWAYEEYGRWYFYGREKGYPINRDVKKGRQYLELVYPKTPELEYMIGLSYEEESDYEMAIYHFNEASKKGYSDATQRLNDIYLYLIYLNYEEDYNSILTIGKVNYLLALYCMEGYGIEKDLELGIMYLRYAAEEGNMDAQGELGDSYFRGNGVEKSFEMGLYWWQKCADSGSGEAKSELKRLFNRLLKKNDKTPIEKYQLGYCYYFGYGTEINTSKALDYMREAADEGCFDAQFFIDYELP